MRWAIEAKWLDPSDNYRVVTGDVEANSAIEALVSFHTSFTPLTPGRWVELKSTMKGPWRGFGS